MAALLCHIQVRAGKSERFEAILKDLAAHTHAHEPGCLRYEYWRGAKPDFYCAFLAFVDARAFYEHQASEYHEQYLDELMNMFEAFAIEYVDPVDKGGADLPATVDGPLGADEGGRLAAQKERYPMAVQGWWGALR